MEKQVLIVVGHKDGKVYLQSGGTGELLPNYVTWEPGAAREVAALLLAAADEAERTTSASPGGLT